MIIKYRNNLNRVDALFVENAMQNIYLNINN